jgi:SAM-dependent methyltransferase
VRRLDLADLPTEVAPDGAPVAVYLTLPAGDEVALIAAALAPGSSVLELGCGAGRVSRALVARGHRVVAVDQSLDMLQHVAPGPSLRPVRADIEALALDETFGGVLLASYLVNTANRAQRARFLETCRRHVAEDGIVVVQRVDPQSSWTIGTSSTYGPVRVQLIAARPHEHFMEARLEYRVGPRTFQQSISIEILDDTVFETALTEAGLRLDRWLDDAHTWAAVRACSVER